MTISKRVRRAADSFLEFKRQFANVNDFDDVANIVEELHRRRRNGDLAVTDETLVQVEQYVAENADALLQRTSAKAASKQPPSLQAGRQRSSRRSGSQDVGERNAASKDTLKKQAAKAPSSKAKSKIVFSKPTTRKSTGKWTNVVHTTPLEDIHPFAKPE